MTILIMKIIADITNSYIIDDLNKASELYIIALICFNLFTESAFSFPDIISEFTLSQFYYIFQIIRAKDIQYILSQLRFIIITKVVLQHYIIHKFMSLTITFQ